jgi:hypothetical protein
MKLHVDWKIINDDLHALLNACQDGLTGTQRHKQLAEQLHDPDESNRKVAKFGLIVNCIVCEESLRAAVNTIWQNGSPVSLQLHDGKCPSCGSTEGFQYKELETFHA